MLDIKNLSVAYGESTVIEGMNFAVPQGEILGIVGRNGMGKTTLFRNLIGMIPTAKGEVRLEENEVTRDPSHKRVAKGMAYVPQGRMVFPYLTVYENLVCGARGKNKEDDLLEIYSLFPVLQEMRHRKAGNLSGGQQQQLVIGRALMTKPKVLLLDEPTEGIQPSIIKDISRTLREIRSMKDLTIVVSEQVLSFVLDTCDRLMVIEKGAIVREDKTEEVDANAVRKMLSV